MGSAMESRSTARASAPAETKSHVVDSRSPETSVETAQRKLEDRANESPEARKTAQLRQMLDESPRVEETARFQETTGAADRNGLPEGLKSGIESLSGFSMDDVTVHRNSEKPAQLQALAYAQSSEIHLGPGQDRHLPHEAWHVVQQKQGRVRPTLQMREVGINDDAGLEREADMMGTRAASLGGRPAPAQLQERPTGGSAPVQRAVGFEFQTYQSGTDLEIFTDEQWRPYGDDVEERYAQGNGVKVEKDGTDLEFVTNAFPESDAGRDALIQAMRTIVITALGLENTTTLTSEIWQKGPDLEPGADARADVRVLSVGPMKAQPQATVGVKLDSLNPLLEALSAAPKRETTPDLRQIFDTEMTRPKRRQSNSQLHKVLASELGKNINDATQSLFSTFAYPMAERFVRGLKGAPFHLQGFLMLLGLYIFGARAKGKYAKSRTPVLARTNLADAFAMLPPASQKWFAEQFLPQSQTYLAELDVDVAKPLYPTYPYGEMEAVGLSEEEVNQKTVGAWLSKLVPVDLGGEGVDITSDLEGLGVISNANRVDDPDPEDYRQKWFSAAYGEDVRMQESTDIGGRERLDAEGMTAHRLQGIILELRNLGDNQLDLSEWPAFALSLFDLIVLVNSDNMKQVKTLSEAMREQRSFARDLGDEPMPGIFAGARQKLSS